MAEEETEVLTDRALSESMDESIRATLHEIQAREPAAEPAAPIDKVDDAVIAESEATGAAQRARDEAGKFTKKTESAAPAKADTPKEPTTAAAQEPGAAEPEAPLKFGDTPVDIKRPPSSWKPAAKAAWAALPEVIRAEIYRRETNYSNDQRGIRENADFGQAVKATIDPYRAMIQAEGGTPERAIADTMKTAALFRTGTAEQKLNAIFEIDKQFCGGALNQHFFKRLNEELAKRGGAAPADGAQPAALPPPADPRVDRIVEAMERQERERAAFERENQAKAAKASNDAVETFIAAKDAKGAPQYPFVDNVLADMSERVAVIRRADPALPHGEALKQAYEQAVWANPETRAVLIAAQNAQATQPADAQRKVADAKRASAGNVPKRGALPATGPAQSLDDTIRETGRALGMF